MRPSSGWPLSPPVRMTSRMTARAAGLARHRGAGFRPAPEFQEPLGGGAQHPQPERHRPAIDEVSQAAGRFELCFLNHVRRVYPRPQRRLDPPRHGAMNLRAMSSEKFVEGVRVAPLDPYQELLRLVGLLRRGVVLHEHSLHSPTSGIGLHCDRKTPKNLPGRSIQNVFGGLGARLRCNLVQLAQGILIMKGTIVGQVCRFLATSSAVAFMMTSTVQAKPPPVQGQARPNVVFIFTDDHAFQAISAYDDPRRLIETPHIDRLAREGMRFDRCIVTNSICGPSRAAVLTGKYSHRNGFYNNTNSRFDGSQTTFPKLLRAAGYQTAIFGKWHLVSDPTGFDLWQVLPGQGVYYHPPMIKNGERVILHGYTTDLITDLSLDWLRKRDKSRPFLLMCQHKAPHREWLPALRHLGHDGDRVYPEPPTLFDDYSGHGKAEHDQDMMIASTMTPHDLKLEPPSILTAEERQVWDAYYEPRNAAFRAAKLQGAELLRWKYQRYLHDYLGCVKAVDESVGRCSTSSTRPVWPATRSSSTHLIRDFIWESTAGSTSAGSSRNRCALP